jgi:hypothetical protein
LKPADEMLPIGPLRTWLERQIAERGQGEVAKLLDVWERTLHRWLHETSSAERSVVEDALHRAGVGLWEVYGGVDDPGQVFDRWCPTCREFVVTNYSSLCPWCDASTLAARPPRHGRRPKWRTDARIPEDRVTTLYERHEAGESIRALGRELWEQLGYASAASCARAICKAFRKKELPARDRAEATARSNVDRRLPGSPGKSDVRAYKRWQRAKRGGRRHCAGVRAWPPRKGDRCQAWAQLDSDFCAQHDPRRADERAAHLASMRARIGSARAPSLV